MYSNPSCKQGAPVINVLKPDRSHNLKQHRSTGLTTVHAFARKAHKPSSAPASRTSQVCALRAARMLRRGFKPDEPLSALWSTPLSPCCSAASKRSGSTSVESVGGGAAVLCDPWTALRMAVNPSNSVAASVH